MVSADIQWQEDGTPRSGQFDDVYFSTADGLEETRHVFIQGNQLADRWRTLTAGSHFIIIETGFGTGLNFLAAWQLWRQVAPSGSFLHYVSIEKYPLAHSQVKRTADNWPELADLNHRLAECYPPLLPGLHTCQLDDGVNLTLCFGDVDEMLEALGDCNMPEIRRTSGFRADAWFLDGFAPAKNPDMWRSEVLAAIGELSQPGCTFATFTAAGDVKRGLAAAGFEINKVKGFGRKRDMLCGDYQAPPPCPSAPRKSPAPWHVISHKSRPEKHALVVGAGLAGSHSAYALARSGWQVDVVESEPQAAQHASGNPSGILYTRLSPKPSELPDFFLHAYSFASRFYQSAFEQNMLSKGMDGELNGMIQLAYSEKETVFLRQLSARFDNSGRFSRWLEADEVNSMSGLAVDLPGLLLQESGWLCPPRVCEALLKHPGIKTHYDTAVDELQYKDGRWHLVSSGRDTLSAETCIIATGIQTKDVKAVGHLPLKGVPGQITSLSPGVNPHLPLCHEGYMSPGLDGTLHCGATFRLQNANLALTKHDQQENLDRIQKNLPTLYNSLALGNEQALAGRVATRCTTPDYMPIIGPAPDPEGLAQRFAPLARNAKARLAESGSWLPGLYLNTGHSSRGLASAPMGAAYLTALLNQTPRPLPWRLQRAISPARFLIRDLIRGKS